MLTRKPIASSLKRAALLTTAAALAITMAQPSMAASLEAKSPTAVSAHIGTSDVTDFSAQRRRYSRGGGGYGGAAAAAAVAGIVGTAIIASQADRGYGYGYGNPYDSYAYSGGPVYDGGGGYYGNPGYYGRSTGYFNGNGGVPLFKGRPLASW